MAHTHPRLTFWQIWNMCFGFLGIQFGFGLQNANVSRIFQTLGATTDDIPLLWIAAPLTGLVVQPIIGYMSDRTWTRLGRRRPYFLVGALLASSALLVMPNSPALWIAAGLLWILDASINISMEPFRAFVGDQLGPPQRPAGYAMQSFFIGVGAVVASMLPWILAHAGVSNHGTNASGEAILPDTVRYAFAIGAAVFFLAVLWTVLRTREYPPDELRAFTDGGPAETKRETAEESTGGSTAAAGKARPVRNRALLWLAAGALGAALVAKLALDRQVYLVCGAMLVWGIALLIYGAREGDSAFDRIMHDFEARPRTMRRLAAVQFFTWIALFSMWLYTTPAITQVHFHTTDAGSDAYNEGANWVGVLFAAYSGYAALAAIAIPFMVRRLGLKLSHLVNLWLGALGLLSILWIRDPDWLLLSMAGVGCAWSSILSIPYALLSDSVPAEKMGLYMGFFNFFIVIPQLLAAAVLSNLLKIFFAGAPIYALVIGGACLLVAGALVLRVPEPPRSAGV